MTSDPPSLSWSATFAVASPTASSSKILTGDKIILPQSALEQLLAAASSNSAAFSVPQRNSYYSRSQLQQEQQQQLPNPLTFRLVNQANGNTVYAGIREFSAGDGVVVLSNYLLDALGIAEDSIPINPPDNTVAEPVDLAAVGSTPSFPRVSVHVKELAKGEYVRLRPLEAGYNPDDWKSLLERQLRESFTTLTNGASMTVRGAQGEAFHLLIDKFRPEGNAICVVDTDLEVDIEALNEEQARETMRQIMTKAQRQHSTSGGSSTGHEIDIWKAVEGQVAPGDYVDYELPSWGKSRPLEIELSGFNGDYAADILISPKSPRHRALPRVDEHVFGVFRSAQDGVKSVTIQPSKPEMEGAESLLISVHGYRLPTETAEAADTSNASDASDATPARFTLRARSVLEESASRRQKENSPPEPPDEDLCQNCRQKIPKKTMILHENFCRRNNILCPHCDKVFQKSSDEWAAHWHCPHDDANGSSEASRAKHDDIYHTDRACPSCPFTTNSTPDLARHRTTLCPGKIILCQFCHLEVPQEGDPFNPSAETLISGLTEHEIADGARTTDCHLCGKIVRLRDMSAHLKHHELDKAHRPKPAICRNINCGRTQLGVGRSGAPSTSAQSPGNDLGLCSMCYGPLYVQLHDPEGKALRRRIERRYLSQLMTGCGKRWCNNLNCRTGRTNRGMETLATTAQTALPHVKPLMEALAEKPSEKARPMYFCVDESNTRRRMLAEMLDAEGLWELEWCVAAAEAGGNSLDKAREWLGNWAPMMF